MPINCSSKQFGLTLIELIMFITIVSVGIVGILSVLNVTARSSADPAMRKQVLAIAESLMEEIQLKDFDATVASRSGTACFAGAASQANRSSFDCIDSYNGFPTAPAAGVYSVTDSTTPIAGLASYSASVAITTTTFSWNDGAAKTTAAGTVKIITITVTDPTNATYTLTGYRFNYG